MFFVFAGLAGYLVLFRGKALLATFLHPVALAGFVFVGIGLFFELVVHDSDQYYEALRYLLMIVGGVLIATMCRDRKAFLWAVYGFLILSIWMSISLIFTSYGAVSSAKANDFKEASQIRKTSVAANKGSHANLNAIAFFIAQGVILGVVLSLTTEKFWRRYLFLGISAFCFVACLLTMSRGALVIISASCLGIVYAYGMMRLRVVISGLILLLGVFIWAPDAVFSRMVFSLDGRVGGIAEDARVEVYSIVVRHFPEYVLTGVGVEGFYGKWGRTTRFWDGMKVHGSHNAFAQITIFWGLSGLLGFLWLLWKAYRYIPRPCGKDPLRLCLLGISISAFLELLIVHNLSGKEFSLALGMIIGGSQWLWRNHAVGSKVKSHIPRQRLRVSATQAARW
ncbi:MAG: hypothetical protein NPIRA02_38630 [Nitrospirales bacterium]|nr:MAG: hypothetical protein NPIRA02_38630 [Nitrospirales bacterium]